MIYIILLVLFLLFVLFCVYVNECYDSSESFAYNITILAGCLVFWFCIVPFAMWLILK